MVGSVGLWRKGEAPQVIGDRALLQADHHGPIATASARVDGQRLVIDLGNSIPETGTDLVKRDFGPLTVTAGAQPVATLPYTAYDCSAYEASAGIVSLPLAADALARVAAGDLALQDRRARSTCASRPPMSSS